MKKLLKWLADNVVFLSAVWVVIAATLTLVTWAYEAGVVARRAKRMQSQMAVESVRRGYAELVVNTNTGDFEVRLKEVAP